EARRVGHGHGVGDVGTNVGRGVADGLGEAQVDLLGRDGDVVVVVLVVGRGGADVVEVADVPVAGAAVVGALAGARGAHDAQPGGQQVLDVDPRGVTHPGRVGHGDGVGDVRADVGRGVADGLGERQVDL